MFLARLVLKRVRIHGVEAESEGRALFSQADIVVCLIPGEVQRDARGRPAELLDDGAVRQLLMDVGRFARDGELGETGPASTRRPAGGRDREGPNLALDSVEVQAATRQGAIQRGVVILESVASRLVMLLDLILGEREAGQGIGLGVENERSILTYSD